MDSTTTLNYVSVSISVFVCAQLSPIEAGQVRVNADGPIKRYMGCGNYTKDDAIKLMPISNRQLRSVCLSYGLNAAVLFISLVAFSSPAF